VKVRGFRIELGEIEAALLEQPGVKQALATVAIRPQREGDVRLVAYVVPDTLDAAYLRERLRARLPDYMVPQHVMQLRQMPLLPNGKIDRSRLPAPDYDQNVKAAARQPGRPLTPQEKILSEIWSELLGTGNIASTDNFFELGGHSILAMQAIVRTEKQLGIRIQPRRMIFETLEQLALSDAAQSGQPTVPEQANGITAISADAKPAAEPNKGLLRSIASRLGLR
jgi:acyl carrier protein